MPATHAFIDGEGLLRSWARAHAALAVLVSARVFFALPEKARLPAITLQRVGGGPVGRGLPLDEVEVQFDAWAQSRAQAAQVAAALVTAVEGIDPWTRTPGFDVSIQGGSVDSVLWLPDPASDLPRFVVSATFVVTAAVVRP